MRALGLLVALAGCSQVIGIDDFEVSEPGIDGRLGVRLNENQPQTDTDVILLDGVTADWENPVGTSVSESSVMDGYYNIAMDRLSGSERDGGSLHFSVTDQSLDVYVDLRRRVEFGQTIDVVIPDASIRPSNVMIAVLVRDRFGTAISDVTVELQDENEDAIALDPVYLDDDQLPSTRGTTGGFGLAWFYGTEVAAGGRYQAYVQSGQTEYTSRIITMTADSFHFLATEEEE